MSGLKYLCKWPVVWNLAGQMIVASDNEHLKYNTKPLILIFSKYHPREAVGCMTQIRDVAIISQTSQQLEISTPDFPSGLLVSDPLIFFPEKFFLKYSI
jgi:hypothetical protein